MNVEFYQSLIERIKNWNRNRPAWIMWAIVASLLLIYYLLVVMPLDNAVSDLQSQIKENEEQIIWIKKMTPQILRLRQTAPRHEKVISGSLFSLINQSVNNEGWASLVSDAHQVDDNNVEISFNSINYNDLMKWLQSLYDQYGIYVAEANLQKGEPGMVQATLTLQRHVERKSISRGTKKSL